MTVGVMTILEGPLCDEAKRLWRVFEVEYGSVGVQTFAHPNLTFGGARVCDPRTFAERLGVEVGRLPSFELKVDGVGFFSKPERVVFLRVVLTEELAAIHHILDRVLEQHCDGLVDLYRPSAWVPHITLAMGDLSQEAFDAALSRWSNYRRTFEQTADQVSLVGSTNDGSGYEVLHRWKVGTRPDGI
jgi:2'-5' RNA ligase